MGRGCDERLGKASDVERDRGREPGRIEGGRGRGMGGGRRKAGKRDSQSGGNWKQ